MDEVKLAKIEKINDPNVHSYTVKDRGNVYFAQFNVLEMDASKKSVLIRLKTFRYPENDELEELLSRIYSAFTKRGEFYKVNIIVSDDINFTPFSKLGFQFEGIFRDNVYKNSIFQDEYLFGVTPQYFKISNNVKLVELEGDNVKLKLSTIEDAPFYLEYHKENMEFLKPYGPVREPKFYTLNGQVKDLKEKFQNYINGSLVPFGIYYRGKLIGKISISNIVYGSFKSCTIGYSLHQDYLNKGFMTEAVRLTCRYAFNEMGLHRVEASTLVDNMPSQKVLINAGFTKIGMNPEYLQINGKWQDHNTFALTSDIE